MLLIKIKFEQVLKILVKTIWIYLPGQLFFCNKVIM